VADNGAVTSPRSIAILGSTGSIGTQAIEVVSANPGRFRVRVEEELIDERIFVE